MRIFKELQVWQKAHRLTLDLYGATKDFPTEERFGLQSQLRRAAVSICSNIAEGCGRGGEREFAHFLNMANGSASEVEYQLLLAKDLGHLTEDKHRNLEERVQEVGKMLTSFIRSIDKEGR